MLYSRGIARASMMGYEPTHNPNPAAAAMLGKGRLKRAAKAYKRRLGRRSAHRGNPVPALVATLAPVIGKYLSLGGPDPAKQAIRLQTLQRYAEAGNLKELDAVAARMEGHGVAINDVTVNAARDLAAKVRAHLAQTAAPTTLTGVLGSLAGSPAAVPIVRELVKQSKPKRQRYPTYVNRQGRQQYSYKPPGSDLRIPAGAVPTPGSPYSFFRGAVGGGGVGTTAAQVAVAGAVGLGAYFATQRVLQYLGGRAQTAEEAGVNASIAHRKAIEDLQAKLGRKPTQAELQEINVAWLNKLVELGYDTSELEGKGLIRHRSATERFFETYNPLGG